MSKREKIILILTVVVAVAAGIFLLLDSSGKKKTAAPPARTSTPAPKSAQPAAKSAKVSGKTASKKSGKSEQRDQDRASHNAMNEKMVLTQDEQRIIVLTARGWAKDPFYKQPEKVENTRKIEKDLFWYTGFINVDREKFAVINNLQFAEGDKLLGTSWEDYTLQSITPKEVVIVSPNNTRIIVEYHENVEAWEDMEDEDPPTSPAPKPAPNATRQG